MPTITIEREELQQIVENLPDEKVSEALLLIRDFCDEGHEPNEETAAVLADSEAGCNMSRIYDDIEEMLSDLLKNDNA